MSYSCIFQHDVPYTAPRCRESAGNRSFLLALAISALIWASLAVGTILTVG